MSASHGGNVLLNGIASNTRLQKLISTVTFIGVPVIRNVSDVSEQIGRTRESYSSLLTKTALLALVLISAFAWQLELGFWVGLLLFFVVALTIIVLFQAVAPDVKVKKDKIKASNIISRYDEASALLREASLLRFSKVDLSGIAPFKLRYFVCDQLPGARILARQILREPIRTILDHGRKDQSGYLEHFRIASEAREAMGIFRFYWLFDVAFVGRLLTLLVEGCRIVLLSTLIPLLLIDLALGTISAAIKTIVKRKGLRIGIRASAEAILGDDYSYDRVLSTDTGKSFHFGMRQVSEVRLTDAQEERMKQAGKAFAASIVSEMYETAGNASPEFDSLHDRMWAAVNSQPKASAVSPVHSQYYQDNELIALIAETIANAAREQQQHGG